MEVILIYNLEKKININYLKKKYNVKFIQYKDSIKNIKIDYALLFDISEDIKIDAKKIIRINTFNLKEKDIIEIVEMVLSNNIKYSLFSNTHNTRYITRNLIRGEQLKDIGKESNLFNTIINLRSGKHNDEDLKIFSGKNNINLFYKDLENFHRNNDNSFYYYQLMVNDLEVNKKIIKYIFKNIKNGVFIHCQYGIDRTGFISFLISYILGYTFKQIKNDYLLSFVMRNEELNFENFFMIDRIIGYINSKYKSIDQYISKIVSIEEIKIFRNDVFQGNRIIKINNSIYFSDFNLFDLENNVLILFCQILRAKYQLDNLKSNNNDVILYKKMNNEIIKHENGIQISFNGFNEILNFSEFHRLNDEIIIFLNKQYGKKDIDFALFDPMYLESVLCVDIPYIENVSYESIQLNELKCFSISKKEGIKLEESRYYMQIMNNEYSNLESHPNNFIDENNEERIKRSLKNMRNNEYGNNSQLIILYNDSNIIRDGEHRASALLFLYGNIEIKVMRIKFKRNYYAQSLFLDEVSR